MYFTTISLNSAINGGLVTANLAEYWIGNAENTYSHRYHAGARRAALALGGKVSLWQAAGGYHHRQTGLQTVFPYHHHDYHQCGDLRDSLAVQEVDRLVFKSVVIVFWFCARELTASRSLVATWEIVQKTFRSIPALRARYRYRTLSFRIIFGGIFRYSRLVQSCEPGTRLFHRRNILPSYKLGPGDVSKQFYPETCDLHRSHSRLHQE